MPRMSQPLDVCLGLLVNEGPVTLRNTLKSWSDAGLLRIVAEKLAFIQGPGNKATSPQHARPAQKASLASWVEWRDWVAAVVQQYSLKVLEPHPPRNIMFMAIVQLAEACSGSSWFLFLEEDFMVSPLARAASVWRQLAAATAQLQTGLIKGVRMRHIRDGGYPNYALEAFRSTMKHPKPEQLALSPFERYPCPDCYLEHYLGSLNQDPVAHVRRCMLFRCLEEPQMYCMRASGFDEWYPRARRDARPRYVMYTNNPMVWPSRWYAQTFTRFANNTNFYEFEQAVQTSSAWLESDIIIARGEGLFRHLRMDRGRTVPKTSGSQLRRQSRAHPAELLKHTTQPFQVSEAAQTHSLPKATVQVSPRKSLQRCLEQPVIDRRRITPVMDNVTDAPGVEVVHSDVYRAASFDQPASVHNLWPHCPYLLGAGTMHRAPVPIDGRVWRFCVKRMAAPWQSGSQLMRLHIIRQRCAFFDKGRRHAGATFDASTYILAAHSAAVPSFHMSNLVTFDRLATALSPYSYEAKSHFFAGTAQTVLTLYDVLPSDVLIVVSWSPELAKLYALFDIDHRRLVHFKTHATYYANELYSVVPSPYGKHGRVGGEPLSPQGCARVRAHMSPALLRKQGREAIVVISRADKYRRKCSSGDKLLGAVREYAASLNAGRGLDLEVVEFVGRDHSLKNAAALFARACVVIGPHGGAFMNLVFARPGTHVIEIGYVEATLSNPPKARWQEENPRFMLFPPFFMTFARQLGLRYWLVVGPGSYSLPIDCPVRETLRTLQQAIGQNASTLYLQSPLLRG